jgi:hypothetical protein
MKSAKTPVILSTFGLITNHFLRLFFAVMFVVVIAGTTDALVRGHYQIAVVFFLAILFFAYRIRKEHQKIKAHQLASKGEIRASAGDDSILKF